MTYVALQVAFYLGFEQVILIGVDHNFATKGKPNTTVVSQGDDPNHFNPAYFGKGFSLAAARSGYLGTRLLDGAPGL